MTNNFVFANNVSTNLSESIDATSTVINVLSGTGSVFPSPTNGSVFSVTLVDSATRLVREICYCTSRSGDSLTVVRGQEGTTARAWSAGDIAAQYITAGALSNFLQPTSLSGYATQAWVNSLGYATQSWVNSQNYATQSWVNSQGYATQAWVYSLGYATQTWVYDQNYINNSAFAAGILHASTAYTAIASSQSVTVPSWAYRVEVVAVGGGGGGCNCQTTTDDGNKSGGGGGSGEYRHGIYDCTPGQTLSLQIGGGGASQTNGSDTIVTLNGSVVIRSAGGYGAYFYGQGISAGAGGGISGSGGNITSVYGTSGSDGQNGLMYFAGNGGSSYFGGGGRAGAKGGQTGSAFGAGGGGAYDPTNSGTAYYGGDGAPGLVLFRFLP